MNTRCRNRTLELSSEICFSERFLNLRLRLSNVRSARIPSCNACTLNTSAKISDYFLRLFRHKVTPDYQTRQDHRAVRL